MSDEDRPPPHLRIVTESKPAWEDTGYGATPDPEVIRDRQLQRRPRGPQHTDAAVIQRIASWQPEIVTSAKCAGCDAPVEVTAEGMDAIETFSRKLERDGQAPIDMNACFSCADCRAKRSDAALRKSTERRGRVTEAVRYLKSANDNPIGEAMGYVTTGKGLPSWNVGDAVKAAHERLAFLAKVMGLGYVVDLLTSIREGRKTPGRAKPKAGDL